MEELMLVNPAKRRKRRKSSKKRAVARRPIRRRRVARAAPKRRRRRNPVGGDMTGQIMNAAVGATGALAVDVAMAQLPLPDQLTATPAMRSATQGGVSLVIGMLVARFGRKRKLGRQLAEGGLTVALHGMGKGLIGPTLGLSGYDDGLLGWGDESLLGAGGMGAYVNGGMGAYMNPAPVSSGDFDDSDMGFDTF